MRHALGLTGDQTIMAAIARALGIAGVLGLFMAIFWSTRWRMKYRAEVGMMGMMMSEGASMDGMKM